jgi:hypothetical protein
MFVYTIIILLVAVVLGALTIIIVNKNPKLKGIFQIGYAVIIIVLAGLMIARIMQPIHFKQERKKREDAAIERLKEIRTVQEAYKDKYGEYIGSFDTLFTFIETDSFEIPKLEIVGEWNQDEITRKQALKQGILKKSIIKKSVKDSLFAPGYDYRQIQYIPYTNEQQFEMASGEVETGSQVKVKVFEAYALYDDLFNGMDRQMVINYKDERYKITEFEGVKVGSLEEANNNAGNWEK